MDEGKYYFTDERLTEQRREIETQGFAADPFLEADPDCPVFGVNLACAYPFPAAVAENYLSLAARCAALDDSVYVYPLWQTHVTIATFVNFTLHRRPVIDVENKLRGLIEPLSEMLSPLLENIRRFSLEFQPPVLTRKAAILPIINSSGEISRIRQGIREVLAKNKDLQENVTREGLNIPGIVHSTIMRFRKVPQDAKSFCAGFEAAAALAAPFTVEVPEFFLTLETKPYMRQGEIVQRFSL